MKIVNLAKLDILQNIKMLSNEEMVLYLQFLRLKHGLTDVAFEGFIKFISLAIHCTNLKKYFHI